MKTISWENSRAVEVVSGYGMQRNVDYSKKTTNTYCRNKQAIKVGSRPLKTYISFAKSGCE